MTPRRSPTAPHQRRRPLAFVGAWAVIAMALTVGPAATPAPVDAHAPAGTCEPTTLFGEAIVAPDGTCQNGAAASGKPGGRSTQAAGSPRSTPWRRASRTRPCSAVRHADQRAVRRRWPRIRSGEERHDQDLRQPRRPDADRLQRAAHEGARLTGIAGCSASPSTRASAGVPSARTSTCSTRTTTSSAARRAAPTLG